MKAIKTLSRLGLATGLFMLATGGHAAFSDQDDRAYSGTIACGGNHFYRLGGTEAQTTRYILRNYGDNPVRIEQLTVYAADASVLFTANGATLPTFVNGVLGAGDNELKPNETAMLRTEDFLPAQPTNKRPISMKIEWAADKKTLLPEFVWVRTTFRREQTGTDPVTGNPIFNTRETRGRHLNSCRSVIINKGRRDRHNDNDD